MCSVIKETKRLLRNWKNAGTFNVFKYEEINTNETMNRELTLVFSDDLERWDGRGCMFTYAWFMLLHSRNEHNIVKQLYSDKKYGYLL